VSRWPHPHVELPTLVPGFRARIFVSVQREQRTSDLNGFSRRTLKLRGGLTCILLDGKILVKNTRLRWKVKVRAAAGSNSVERSPLRQSSQAQDAHRDDGEPAARNPSVNNGATHSARVEILSVRA
jgi:hypothetical protein